MAPASPLQLSRFLLSALGTRTYTYYGDRVPREGSLLVISNHRSFMDALLLMEAVGRSVHFACHHYMGQVPIMREVVNQLGCFPLEEASTHRQQSFFEQASQLLRLQQAVGVFPEGPQTMVKQTTAEQIGDFQRGFAHLALRAPVPELAILPVAIAPIEESSNAIIPLRFLSLFDPSEPLFQQQGWHPLVMYQRVNLLIGRPIWIQSADRQKYRGKEAGSRVADLTHRCHAEIDTLLHQGSY